MLSPNRLKTIALILFVLAFVTACGDDTSEDADDQLPGTLLEGDTERDTDPDIDSDDFAEFSTDNRSFAFSLFEELRDQERTDENLFVSPHSISSAMAMIYGGAREDTADEMADVLHFNVDDDDLHPAFNYLDLQLDERSSVDEGDDGTIELDIVNQTWGAEKFPFRTSYLDLLAQHYGAGMFVVDFEDEYEQARVDINDWVEEQTNDHITDLLPEDSLDELTRLVLVNAIYFYGSWEQPFDADRTRQEAFTTVDGTDVDVDMMYHGDLVDAGYHENDDTVALSFPYVGGDLSMLLFKPTDGDDDFLAWEDDFDRVAFDDTVDNLETREGWVRLPKFEDEGEFDLVDPFEEQGMVDVFDCNISDLTGVFYIEQIPDMRLCISGIFHQTFVGVDEEGAEAAAATGVVAENDTSGPMPDFSVKFDRPFYYAIYDHGTDTILFLGRMVDPS